MRASPAALREYFASCSPLHHAILQEESHIQTKHADTWTTSNTDARDALVDATYQIDSAVKSYNMDEWGMSVRDLIEKGIRIRESMHTATKDLKYNPVQVDPRDDSGAADTVIKSSVVPTRPVKGALSVRGMGRGSVDMTGRRHTTGSKLKRPSISNPLPLPQKSDEEEVSVEYVNINSGRLQQRARSDSADAAMFLDSPTSTTQSRLSPGGRRQLMEGRSVSVEDLLADMTKSLPPQAETTPKAAPASPATKTKGSPLFARRLAKTLHLGGGGGRGLRSRSHTISDPTSPVQATLPISSSSDTDTLSVPDDNLPTDNSCDSIERDTDASPVTGIKPRKERRSTLSSILSSRSKRKTKRVHETNDNPPSCFITPTKAEQKAAKKSEKVLRKETKRNQFTAAASGTSVKQRPTISLVAPGESSTTSTATDTSPMMEEEVDDSSPMGNQDSISRRGRTVLLPSSSALTTISDDSSRRTDHASPEWDDAFEPTVWTEGKTTDSVHEDTDNIVTVVARTPETSASRAILDLESAAEYTTGTTISNRYSTIVDGITLESTNATESMNETSLEGDGGHEITYEVDMSGESSMDEIDTVDNCATLEEEGVDVVVPMRKKAPATIEDIVKQLNSTRARRSITFEDLDRHLQFLSPESRASGTLSSATDSKSELDLRDLRLTPQSLKSKRWNRKRTTMLLESLDVPLDSLSPDARQSLFGDTGDGDGDDDAAFDC